MIATLTTVPLPTRVVLNVADLAIIVIEHMIGFQRTHSDCVSRKDKALTECLTKNFGGIYKKVLSFSSLTVVWFLPVECAIIQCFSARVAGRLVIPPNLFNHFRHQLDSK